MADVSPAAQTSALPASPAAPGAAPPPADQLHLPGIEQLQPMARGGFAAVYRGWQPAFERWVAVKVLAGGHTPGYRFDREVRAVGALSGHPNVVPVYEAGQIDGRPYLVMPYLTGGSLQDRIASRPLDAHEALSTGVAVAGALAEAHRIGILHRDIKPANILFTGYGAPQLADFGVARFADSTTTTGLMAVTVGYAAPEVLSGEPATAASDVYSLGATLYAALVGNAPFPATAGASVVAQAMRVVHSEPADLRTLGVAAPVAAVIERAMAKDPAARYPSAEALRDALAHTTAAIAAAPTMQRPTPGPPTPRRAAPRRVPRAGLLAAAIGLVAVIAIAAGFAASTNSGGTAARKSAGPTTTAPPATTAPTSTTPPRAPSTTAAHTATPPPSAPSPAPGTTPPSAGSATSPAQLPPSTLSGELQDYYALVNQHLLDDSWQWLSPAFQARIGRAYYSQFWGSIASVHVVAVNVSGSTASITLNYVATNGSSSQESANLGFTIVGGRVLIDTDQVTGG